MGRDAGLDAAKGALILLVLAGHLVWPVPWPHGPDGVMPPAGQAQMALYGWIYLFHMPMFAMVSGVLSRAGYSWGLVRSVAGRLLLPYVVFGAIQAATLLALGEAARPLWGLYGLWYLLSLAWWRLLLPAFVHLPRPMLWAVALAVGAGWLGWIGMPLSLSRTCTLFPFFLAGHLLRGERAHLPRLFTPAAAVAVLALCAGLCWLAAPANVHVLLYGNQPYQVRDLSPWVGPLVRLGRLGLGFAAGLAFLSLMPSGRGVLGRLGERSLYVYILHAALLPLYRAAPWLWEPLNAVPVLGVLAGAVASGFLLARASRLGWVRRLVEPLPGRRC